MTRRTFVGSWVLSHGVVGGLLATAGLAWFGPPITSALFLAAAAGPAQDYILRHSAGVPFPWTRTSLVVGGVAGVGMRIVLSLAGMLLSPYPSLTLPLLVATLSAVGAITGAAQAPLLPQVHGRAPRWSHIQTLGMALQGTVAYYIFDRSIALLHPGVRAFSSMAPLVPNAGLAGVLSGLTYGVVTGLGMAMLLGDGLHWRRPEESHGRRTRPG